MAIMKQHIGGVTAFPQSSFLNGTTDVTARSLGVVDMSTNDYPNAKVRLTVNLSTATAPGGLVELYFLGSIDNTNWTDGITPSSSANHIDSLNTAEKIMTFNTDQSTASQDVNWICNDMQRLVGDLPPYWSLVVKNVSGSTFEAAGHTAQYYTVSYKGTT